MGCSRPREASLSVSVFSRCKIHNIQSVLAFSPGGLEGFPHTVLRCFANEGSGNAKCSRACACQRDRARLTEVSGIFQLVKMTEGQALLQVEPLQTESPIISKSPCGKRAFGS